MQIAFKGDNWNDEHEAEELESLVQDALDDADVDYLDIKVV